MNVPTLDRFRKKDVVGMDIGAHSTKFLRWIGEKKTSQVFCYPKNILNEAGGEAKEFSEFLRAHGLSGASVACAVDVEAFKIKKFDLPKMPESDLSEAVKWEMREVIEGPVEKYVVRHLVVEEHGSSEGTKLSLLGFAIKSDDVRELVQFLRKCSLKPVALEPSPVSLVAAFAQVEGFPKDRRYGLIDLGIRRPSSWRSERGGSFLRDT